MSDKERQPTLEPDFKAFKDGVYDAIIHGRKAPVTELSATFIRGQPSGHYYDRGYDFGTSVASVLGMTLSLRQYRLLSEEE